MTILLPFSAACERNKDAILDVISSVLDEVDHVLEIGTGTAQHALHFAQAKPHLEWQTSDCDAYLDGIRAQLLNAKVENIRLPLGLNVNQTVWVEAGLRFPLIYTANTLHIMAWTEVEALFAGLPTVSADGAYFIVYGPFKYHGRFTSESNAQFDQSLRGRGQGSGIRDVEAVVGLADQAGFGLLRDVSMPANNQCLVFRRRADA
ncbi:DUF938 domain-containing protein [Arenicella xantha]|uniref:Uncharacterized protein DUF938 n=1 Tax=Arenicella xantha TaxID=644221 RepID=A0A395JNG6_9GAMM|nr:DUF938 domain-containing protein [Arenicella xantha]RBP52843.1 uncharacterized protein DUF938 [Arenicella xantha]